MLPALLAIAGSVLLYYATHVLIRANPHSKIPAGIGNPPVVPDRVFACRFFGIGFLVFGAIQVGTAAWYWGPVLILVLMIPSAVRMALHNRRVARSAGTRPTE